MADAEPTSSDDHQAVTEIHRADPDERRRTALLLAIVAVCGGLLLIALRHELGVIADRVAIGDLDLAAGRFLWLARGSFILLALVGIVTGTIVGQNSLAVIREQRYPHSAARVVRDHRIQRGTRAIRIGRLGLALASAFVLVGCAGAVIGWRLLAMFQ